MRWGTLIAAVLVASLAAVAVGGGAVAGQQNGVRIHDATVGEPSIEQGNTLSVTIEFTSIDPSTTGHEVSIKANGAELGTTLLAASTGERATRTATVYDTESLEPGTYTITVGDAEAGQLTVTEAESVASESDFWVQVGDGYFGPMGQLIGAPILALGVIFYIGAFGIEIIRGFKEYIGDGAEKGIKPAVVALLVGSVGVFAGGFLVGGLALTLAMTGLIVLMVLGTISGGYYGVTYLYREL